MTFTIENTQNDSAAIAIDGYDVAQIQRISFAKEELNDERWQELLDTLDTASHFKTLIDAARGAVEAWSDREGDDEVDAMSHLKSVINQIPSDRVSRYAPNELAEPADIKPVELVLTHGGIYTADELDDEGNPKLREFEVAVTYTDVKGGVTDGNVSIVVLAADADAAEENALDKLGEDGLCWDTITVDEATEVE